MIGSDWYRGNTTPQYRLAEAKRRHERALAEVERTKKALDETSAELEAFLRRFKGVGQ